MPVSQMLKVWTVPLFPPLAIVEKEVEPPVWTSVWQLLFAGDLCFHVGSHDFTKNSFRPL